MENTKAIQTVINKAWEDDDFRSSLVANPKGAIEKATGEKVPDGVNIVVSDQTDTSKMYLNIPPKPNFDDMELTDEQLEQVAGGEFFVGASILLTIAASIGAVSATAAASIGAGSATAAAGISQGW